MFCLLVLGLILIVGCEMEDKTRIYFQSSNKGLILDVTHTKQFDPESDFICECRGGVYTPRSMKISGFD